MTSIRRIVELGKTSDVLWNYRVYTITHVIRSRQKKNNENISYVNTIFREMFELKRKWRQLYISKQNTCIILYIQETLQDTSGKIFILMINIFESFTVNNKWAQFRNGYIQTNSYAISRLILILAKQKKHKNTIHVVNWINKI